MINSLILGVKTRSVIVSTAMNTVVSSMIVSVKGYMNGFYDAGKYLVQGFALGISANTFRAKAQAVTMAQAALNAAKAVLKIKSPSRETYKIGDFFGQGFVNAIGDSEGGAYNAGRSMAENARKGLSKAIGTVRDLMENGIDAQPTIRPVVDLSEVEAGAGAIGGMFSNPSVRAMSNIGAISTMMNSRQNGITNSDVVSAIKDLGSKIGNTSGDTYNMNGITYDDGSNISNAMKDIVRAAKIERRT